jgi:hypothetical protein
MVLVYFPDSHGYKDFDYSLLNTDDIVIINNDDNELSVVMSILGLVVIYANSGDELTFNIDITVSTKEEAEESDNQFFNYTKNHKIKKLSDLILKPVDKTQILLKLDDEVKSADLDTVYELDKFQKNMNKEATKIIFAENREKYKQKMRQNSLSNKKSNKKTDSNDTNKNKKILTL